MLTAKQLLEITSVVAAFVSGMTLFWAGLGVPPEEQSWKGQTKRELAIKFRQKLLVAVGIPAAIIALDAQMAAIIGF